MASKTKVSNVGKNKGMKSDLISDEATATSKMPKAPINSDRGRKTGVQPMRAPLEGSRPGEQRIS